ncbi:MAG: hypothetical protein JW818_08385 [Pirellulales bacterium]|nr:hypothetical protein [Pirellulales bacterium]
MNFRSVANLNETIVRNLHQVPRDVRLIVGIPRSGLLAANLLALHLNLPLTDLDGFVEGRLLRSGPRLQPRSDRAPLGGNGRVLVLDDSLESGGAMSRARERLAQAGMDREAIFAAVYISLPGRRKVDLYFEEIVGPRVFEWNFMHHSVLADSCVDIDGVLCVDPTETQNDDGPCYRRFLEEAPPLWLPSAPVGVLVTCRLEKYRSLTEKWLQRHGVQYRRLVMMNLPDKASRQAAGVHASMKAKAYRAANAKLFIESSHRQAVEIARLARRPVLSVERREMIYPSFLASVPSAIRRAPHVVRRRVEALAGRLRRRLFHHDPPTSGLRSAEGKS